MLVLVALEVAVVATEIEEDVLVLVLLVRFIK